jgi:hypothetical protein
MNPPTGKHPSERVLRITQRPNAFDEAKQFAEVALGSYGPTCKEAAVMAVWELTENVLKYGKPDTDAIVGTIGIGAAGETIRISARSMAASFQNARSAMETISKIAASPNVSQLYRTRLRELFDHPEQAETRLGLLRVAFEGRFRLSCAYNPPYFEIIAERACLPPPKS